MKELLIKYNPQVPKHYLMLFAGLMWIGVGLMLNIMALKWIRSYDGNLRLIYPAIGLMAAVIIHWFGFKRVATKNIQRIDALPGKRCAFSFISWKSYLLVIIMMTMGLLLRHSAIPFQYLSSLYFAIGMALVLSGRLYTRRFRLAFRNPSS
jgi:hypothetical protein